MLLRRLIGEDIQLVMALAPDLWPVRADPSQLQQVLTNLAVNARDAMPDGGVLTVQTKNAVLDERAAAEHLGAAPGDFVLVAVSDSGTGIDDAVRAHLFEPLFTTKEHGKGTGLGLATTYGIVSQAGGHISVESGVGTGTMFRVFLPRASEPLSDGAEPGTADSPRGNETILLVEDEALVRGIARRILVEQGYRVLEAANGTEALEIAAIAVQQLDLVITDVLMPGIGGAELAGRVSALHPDVRILYTSGYTADKVETDGGVLIPNIEFLPKPFGPSVLARRVREVLDLPRQSAGINQGELAEPFPPEVRPIGSWPRVNGKGRARGSADRLAVTGS